MNETDASQPDSSDRPAGMCLGSGHLVVHGNPAFISTFGSSCIGMPARETMLSLPPDAFDLLDRVLARGRPLARWITVGAQDWRLTAMPRIDVETGEPYGVSFHLRRRSDLPVIRDVRPATDPGRDWISPPSP